jgi:hypothetical protein
MAAKASNFAVTLSERPGDHTISSNERLDALK